MTKPKKIPQTISIDPPEYILPHYQYDYSYDYVDYPYAYQSTGYWHPKVEDGNKKTKVSFPDYNNIDHLPVFHDFELDTTLESEPLDRDDYNEEKSIAESEGNSIVESLYTQSSKGSGIRVDTSTEERRLEQRQKQIDYGKNTIGYKRYTMTIAKIARSRNDPETPDKNSKCSKRAWDGVIRQWRRKLHQWDPPESENV